MNHLTGTQKKYLRGLAHGKKPVVLIGQKQLTSQVVQEIRQALDYHELIKVKCVDLKERADKKELAETVLQKTGCEMVGIIGHVMTLFRQQQDPEKRKINLPSSAPPEHARSAPPSHKGSV